MANNQTTKPRRATLGSLLLSSDPKKATTEVISTEVPIEFNVPISSIPLEENGQTKTMKEAKPKVDIAQPEKAAGPPENGGDDQFSNYIDRAKAKIRMISNIGGGSGGGGKSGLRLDSFNDKVTRYINRAKIKMRTTSGVGGGKSVSIK